MTEVDIYNFTKDYLETRNYVNYPNAKPGYIRGLYCAVWKPNYEFEDIFKISCKGCCTT